MIYLWEIKDKKVSEDNFTILHVIINNIRFKS